MIVLDASALLELLLRSNVGERIGERILVESERLYAPQLIDVEVAQVLRRYWLAEQITASRAQEAFEDLLALPLFRYPHHIFLERIWELRQDLTAYDAAYLVLAEALDAKLVTCDKAFTSVSGHTVEVELFWG